MTYQLRSFCKTDGNRVSVTDRKISISEKLCSYGQDAIRGPERYIKLCFLSSVKLFQAGNYISIKSPNDNHGHLEVTMHWKWCS